MNTMYKTRYISGFIASVTFLGVAIILGGKKIIEREIRIALVNQGFQVRQLGDISFTKAGLQIEKLGLTMEDRRILIDTVTVEFDFLDLIHRRARAILLEGLQYSGAFDDFKNLALQTSVSGPTKQFFERLTISGFCRLTRTNADPLLIPFSLKLRQAEKYFCFHTTLRVISSTLTGDIDFHFDKENQKFSSKLNCSNLRIQEKGVKLKAKEIHASAGTANDEGSSFQKMDISFKGRELFFESVNTKEPLDLEFKSTIDIGKAFPKIKGEGRINVGGVQENVDIHISTEGSSYFLNLDAPRLHPKNCLGIINYFSPQKVDRIDGEIAFDLHAVLPYPFEKKQGWRVFLNPEEWKNKSGHAKIKLTNLSLKSQNVVLEGINDGLSIQLFPFRILGLQTLSAKAAHAFKIDLENLKVSFLFDNKVKFENFTAGMLKGTISLHSFDMQNMDDIKFMFDAKDVELSDAVTFLEIDGLSGEGRMNGSGQAHYTKENGFVLKNARFFSSSPTGHIQYTHGTELELGAEGAMLSSLLENLTFSSLSVEVSPMDNKLQAFIDIMGYNKAVLNGHPFHFKIKTSGDFQDTIESALSYFKADESFSNVGKDLKKLDENK